MNNYTGLRKIGSGAYGAVYEARSLTTDEPVAIKRASLKKMEEGLPCAIMREIVSLQSLPPHPHVIRLLDVYHHDGDVHLVYPRMAGSLEKQIGAAPLHEDVCRTYLHMVLSALHHLHFNGVFHRDIKPENILLCPARGLCLADFGLSRRFDAADVPSFSPKAITLWYRPPEMLLGSTQYGPSVDIWSVGVMAFECAIGKPLFPGTTEITQLQRIFSVLGTPTEANWGDHALLPKKITFKETCPSVRWEDILPPTAATGLVDFLRNTVVLDPTKRWTAEQCLQSEYFKTGRLLEIRQLPSVTGF
eukprot:PhM_4_TR7559/c0_g1_i2/m.53063/K02206/CDK2; cyclin-dependent kinase 2